MKQSSTDVSNNIDLADGPTGPSGFSTNLLNFENQQKYIPEPTKVTE